MGAAPEMKDVLHSGGQLRFRVPAAWASAEEADGTAAYYDQAAGGGTLRVKLMTFTAEQELATPVAFQELEAMEPEPGQALEALPDGNALRTHHESAVVDGQPTVFHVWLLASVDPPHRLRLAVFSFTEPAARADDAASRGIVAALDREIRGARFAHQLS
jgi:hypothetical protein